MAVSASRAGSVPAVAGTFFINLVLIVNQFWVSA